MSNSHLADSISETIEDSPLRASFGELVGGDAALDELSEALPRRSLQSSVRAGLRALGRSVSDNPKTYAGGAVLAGLMGVGVWQLVLSSRNRR